MNRSGLVRSGTKQNSNTKIWSGLVHLLNSLYFWIVPGAMGPFLGSWALEPAEQRENLMEMLTLCYTIIYLLLLLILTSMLLNAQWVFNHLCPYGNYLCSTVYKSVVNTLPLSSEFKSN